MKRPRKYVQLSPDLERAILSGIVHGFAGPDSVAPEELSKAGRVALGVLRGLYEQRVPTPYPIDHVVLAATDLFGVNKEAFAEFLREVIATQAGQAPNEILRKVRDKQLLLDVINEASEQLGRHTLDIGLVSGLFQRESVGGKACPISDRLKDAWPEAPKGLTIASLPRLTQHTGGIHGLWALAGSPGARRRPR